MNAQLKEKYSLIRDMFIFSCFSGLRFSDVKKLRKSDIKNDKIHIVTQKTSDTLEIELNHYTKQILSKYNSIQSPFIFPIKYTNSIVNQTLKKIFASLNINRLVKVIYFSGGKRFEKNEPLSKIISFHAARRSFVVECLRRGIAPAVIMKWTGHSNYNAMKPYIDIVDTLKASEMGKFDL